MEVHAENAVEGMEHNFDASLPIEFDAETAGKYDPESIMHYATNTVPLHSPRPSLSCKLAIALPARQARAHGHRHEGLLQELHHRPRQGPLRGRRRRPRPPLQLHPAPRARLLHQGRAQNHERLASIASAFSPSYHWPDFVPGKAICDETPIFSQYFNDDMVFAWGCVNTGFRNSLQATLVGCCYKGTVLGAAPPYPASPPKASP